MAGVQANDAPIITMLSTEHEPDSAPRPTLSFSEYLLKLRPELLVRNEIIRVSLLTEGRPGEARVSLNPFGAVDVQVRDRAAWLRQRFKRRAIISTISLSIAAATIAAVITNVSNSSSLSSNLSSLSSLQSIDLQCSLIKSNISTARGDLAEATQTEFSLVQSVPPAGPVQYAPGAHAPDIIPLQFDAVTLARSCLELKYYGVALGNTAQIPRMIQNAVTAIKKLPANTSALESDFGVLQSADRALENGAPAECGSIQQRIARNINSTFRTFG